MSETRLQRIRREIFSHTIWRFTGEPLLAWLEKHWLVAIMTTLSAIAASIWTSIQPLVSNLPVEVQIIIALGVFIIVFTVVCVVLQKIRIRWSWSNPASTILPDTPGWYSGPGLPHDFWDNTQSEPLENGEYGKVMLVKTFDPVEKFIEPAFKSCTQVEFVVKPEPRSACYV